MRHGSGYNKIHHQVGRAFFQRGHSQKSFKRALCQRKYHLGKFAKSRLFQKKQRRPVLGGIIMGTISVQSFFYDFFSVVIDAAYLWLPAITAYFAWKFWLYYIRLHYVSKIDWILLEIKLPREMPKSPQVMEIILSAMYQTRRGEAIHKYWQGMLRAWYSLEIASKEGNIHFY